MSIGYDPKPNSSLIGRIYFEATNEVIPILAGISLDDLRQGAGYYHRSVPFGEVGTSIILGHRESVFYNLGTLKPDDRITIDITDKQLFYKVKETMIADRIDEWFLKQKTDSQLLLVTCYPIKLTGPIEKKYLVIAELQDS